MDLPFVKEAVKGLFSKTSCEMYPFVPSEAAPRYRGRIVFHPEKCINCGMCERVCAGGAIKTESVPVEGGQQITRIFNLGSCTFCSHCADFCHEKAIELTGDYHMVATKEEDLLVTGTFFKAAPKKPAPKPAAAAPAAAAVPGTIKPRDDGKPVQVPSKCVYCTLCAKKCPAGALTVDRAASAQGRSAQGRGRARRAGPAAQRRQARPGSEQVRLLHALRQEVPRRGADGGPCGQDLDARRGCLRGLRHLRRRLPEGRHRHVRQSTNSKESFRFSESSLFFEG